jgi:hypothetical protein
VALGWRCAKHSWQRASQYCSQPGMQHKVTADCRHTKAVDITAYFALFVYDDNASASSSVSSIVFCQSQTENLHLPAQLPTDACPPCCFPGQSVVDSLIASAPAAVVKVLNLDTADSSSIQGLAATVKQEYDQQIDLLVRHTSTMSGNASLQGGQCIHYNRLQTEQACIHQHCCVFSTSGDSEVVRHSLSASSSTMSLQ